MELFSFLQENKIKFVKNGSLAKLSSIRIGGKCKYIIYPKNENELCNTLEICRNSNIPYAIVGGGTNTWFCDGYLGSAVITTALMRNFYTDGSGTVIAQCGIRLPHLIRALAELDMDISAELYGIPGTVGGAIYNNAGAHGVVFGDRLVSARVLDLQSGCISVFDRETFRFGYRTSILHDKRFVLLECEICATSTVRNKIYHKLEAAIEYRRRMQPSEPSLGSFFKRDGQFIPAKLIDAAGLKGTRCGNAEVSQRHAGFLINAGGATANELEKLALLIEERIESLYGVRLKREAEFIG